MRILVYGLSADKLGGIETFLLNMNQFMDNVVFDYIVEGDSTIHQSRIDQKGGKVYFIAPKRQILRNISDWRKLLKKEKEDTTKVVYFNMFSLAWIVPVIQCRLHGYEVIIHAHNNNLHNCGAVLKTLHKLNRGLLKHMKIHRLTNSGLSAEFFFGNKAAEMVYNAIDTKRFSYNAIIRNQMREELNCMEKNVYGFAGRIAYQKNPLFLIEIFDEIRKLDKDAAFLICGDGDLMEETKVLAENKGLDICFVGAQENVQDYYQAMDAFVLPSRFEGLGIVLIEAQTAGLPCVTSADVVPQDAKVTELLTYVPLAANASQWARTVRDNMQRFATKNRSFFGTAVGNTQFNIQRESVRLADLLVRKSR